MAGHWKVILDGLLRTPQCEIGLLPLLTQGELRQLHGPGGWNDTARNFPLVPLTTLIEEQAKRRPEAIAAEYGDVRWTYSELMNRVNVLCRGLRRAGVPKHALVAMLLPRSLDMLAEMLAILKVGAAYLPLDPDAPAERNMLCLKDADVGAVLASRSVESIPGTSAPVLFVEELYADEISDSGGWEADIDVNDLAYVIYTSGTTGKPRGVEISHASLANLLLSMQREPGFTDVDRLLALTTVSFDIAALELFLPLICGGTVVIATREEARDPYVLAEAIERSRCTVIQATPATWISLLGVGWTGPSCSLKLLCGGEPMPRALAERLLALQVEVWNMYGPTETTVWSTLDHVKQAAGVVPIGKPIANTTAYLLDAQKRLLPVGVPGRLYLGGAGLARGYRGLPAETERKFTRADVVEGARLYDTGDLAVRRADGRIECLGRLDNQVKVRGFRVELEAVEAAVQRHPQVAAAATRVWPDAMGSMELSVYIVGRNGPAPSLAELRRFLSVDQPEYMIPSHLVMMDSLPLSLNGKVDRSRLPAPANGSNEVADAEFESETERRLAAIWAEVLRVPAVKRDDNFFDLGGHSLLMAKLERRVEATFGKRISMAMLIHATTVMSQAGLLEDAQRALPAGLVPIQAKGTRTPIYWIHPPSAIGNLVRAFGGQQPFIGVRLTEADLKELGDAPRFEEIASRHVSRILQGHVGGPLYLGGFCTGGILAYEVAAQLRSAGHEVALVILLDAQNPVYYKRVGSAAVEFSKAKFYLRQALREARRGSRATLRQRLFRFASRVGKMWPRKLVAQETVFGERLTEAAAYQYNPKRYAGEVLLLQPDDRPGLIDHIPGWKSVVDGKLVALNIAGQHDDLLSVEKVQSCAVAISESIGEIENCGIRSVSLPHTR
jgi:amino acid adenylation domain-containing protein